jgi:peptidoglycan/LPS O-acetylase OafA/YrhL
MDLQGLRALAVVLVILNHAFDWPTAGFVGVDIFFVISGFLMTSLLHREYERTGSIKLFAFYRRRIRRLLPASVLVILVTVAASWLLFATGRFISTAWDGVASLFFVSNWRFAGAATDYFAQGAGTSPLQHYWSLSLEEQYYLVWPLAVLVIAILVVHDRRPRVTAGLVSLVITFGLFLVSLQLTQFDSATAYFITPARLWELSVGSTIAFCMPLFDRLPRPWRPFIAICALGGMVAAAVITPSSGGFPAPWAALAVVSAALFVAFPWQPERRPWLNPLINPVLGYAGDISYSLYLWHFPALILMTEAFRGMPGEKTPIPAIISIVVSVVLAALSYRFVEEPVRHSSWLEPSTERRRVRSGSALRIVGFSAALVVVATSVGAALLVDRQARNPGPGPSSAATTSPPADSQSGASPGAGASQALATLENEVKSALAEKNWPELAPSMDSVVAGYEFDESISSCGTSRYPGLDACTWGSPDAPRSIAFVGDSTSLAYLAMFRALAESSNGQVRVTSLGMFSCSFMDITVKVGSPGFQRACPERKQQALADIATLKPDILVVTNAFIELTDLETGEMVSNAELTTGLDAYFAQVAPEVGKLVVLAPPPEVTNVKECYSPGSSPSACVSTIPARWTSTAELYRKALDAYGGVFIDTRKLFCAASKCPAFAAGIPIRFDSIHLTQEYSQHLAPAVVDLFDESGVDLAAVGDAGGQPSAMIAPDENAGRGV